jgi:hypothetical protein
MVRLVFTKLGKMVKKMITTIFLTLLLQTLTAPPFPVVTLILSDYETNLLTWSNIDRYISEIDIRQPEIVKAQIRHETGNLTSRFCKEQNNLIGMRLAHSRQTTAIGEGNHMAVYGKWQDSLADYKIWQDKYYKGEDYYQFLSRHGYAEDPYYQYKLKRIKN